MICFKCKKHPDQIEEYVQILAAYQQYAADEGVESDFESTEDFVKAEDGTYNPETDHFCCTDCYIAIGMPSASNGWVAP